MLTAFRYIRYIIFALGVFAGLPLLILLFLIPQTTISLVGIIYLLSGFLIVIGMLCAPWWTRRSLAFILIGSGLAFGTIAIRILFPPSGSQVNIITLPGQAGPRLLNRILNEQDAVLLGAQLAPYAGFISSAEKESLPPTFSQAYTDMNSHGATPLSPFLTTYLGQQRPDQFDVVIAEPNPGTTPRSGIIFLHGFGGNFTVQCWLVGKAGYRIDAITVCPSTGVNAHWWDAQGESILQETFAYLQQRGVERIYLAGLSNGGIGASRLADRFKSDIAGLILISGADPNATITTLPVLVVHGQYDERIPTSMIEQYVSATGSNATYRLFEGDHFLLLKQADQVQEVIANWLIEQETNFQ